MGAPQGSEVRAAGVVVFAPRRRVLLVHRPKYDDWSFPKGKLDPGEHRTAAAVREAAEETGLHVRLGPPLPDQLYEASGRPKRVHYWAGRVVGPDDVEGYRPNDEIDDVRWVRLEEAGSLLSYERDRATLAAAAAVRRRTRAVVVLRHGQARSRRSWPGADPDRPLVQAGRRQAERLVPVLAAFDLTHVVTSPSRRCVDTVDPFVHTAGWETDRPGELTEEGATPARVTALVDRLRADVHDADRSTLLCTHRPVLPHVFDALGVPDPGLEPGQLLVVHLRKGSVVATDGHDPGDTA